MDKEQGKIWYERALFYATQGSKANAEKAYSIARNYDPSLPPLPRFRNHTTLRTMEYICVIAAMLFVAWLIYLLTFHSSSKADADFIPWSITLRGAPTDVAAPAGLESGEGTHATLRQSGMESAIYTRQYRAINTGSNATSAPVATGVTAPIAQENAGDDEASGVAQNLETFTVLRNALYYYTSDRTKFPAELTELVNAGYLEEIPVEPISGLNRVSKSFTGQGGWVYCPPKALIPEKTCEQVETSLYPNRGSLTRYAFLPQTLRVNLAKAKMTLFEGIMPRKSWPVSSGAQATPTPEGKFRIIEKEALANGKANAYGTRWLKLGKSFPVRANVNPKGSSGNQQGPLIPGTTSEADGSTDVLASRGIGIHGTTDNAQVGSPVTNGCIRMRNTDVEELYRLIPNGVRVWIDR